MLYMYVDILHIIILFYLCMFMYMYIHVHSYFIYTQIYFFNIAKYSENHSKKITHTCTFINQISLVVEQGLLWVGPLHWVK